MKSIWLAAALLLAFIGSINAQTLSDRRRDDLLGAVHTVKEERIFFVKTAETRREMPRFTVSTTTYDASGMTTESNVYKKDGTLLAKLIYEYDEKDNRRVVNIYNADGSLNRRETITHDARGYPLQIGITNTEGTLLRDTTIHYDDSDTRSKAITKSQESNPNEKINTRYDEQRRVQEREFIKAGSLEHKEVFTYDSAGRRTELATYNALGILISKDNWIYDNRGRLLEQIHETADGSLKKTSYAYQFDTYGNWTEQTVESRDQNGERLFKQIRYRVIVYYPE